MSMHPVLWTSPQPLWGRFDATAGTLPFRAADQARPAILRFASDDFMEQILAMLEADPRQLGGVIAQPETWRTPAADPPDPVERTPLPRIARALARQRRNEAPASPLASTTSKLQRQENGVEREMTLKLYHPAHQRYYLVAANLICGVAGFPERVLATGGSEQVGFVLRRLLPPANGASSSGASGAEPAEFAFIKSAAGAHWQRLDPDPNAVDRFAYLAPGEELLPLFPLGFRDQHAHPRRLLAGMVPVGRREEYMSARAEYASAGTLNGSGPPAGGGSPTTTVKSARKEQLKLEVTEPWKHLVRTAHATVARILDTDGGTMSAARRRAAALSVNRQAQLQSWLLLLDFADYLALHLPRVWAAVEDPARRAELVSDAERRLFDWLNGSGTEPGGGWRISSQAAVDPPSSFAANLRDALARVRTAEVRNVLENAVRSYPDPPGTGLAWPDFLYLLAGVRETGSTANPSFQANGPYASLDPIAGVAPDPDDADPQPPASPPAPSWLADAETAAALLDKLVQLVVSAIDAEEPATPAPPLPFAVRLRDALASTPDDPGWFVLRCAYVRCDCGPLRPTVLSEPSQHFQLASFYDPDAPARPIRISLPLDTTPAGMRKFNKNTAFVISDVLCGQIQRAKGLGLGDLVRSVLPWPLHKSLDVGGMGPCESSAGNTIGKICSLSIPIITICALILLLIMVMVLDFIFRWLPWLICCFPIPGLRAKGSS
jgi:hypothetical protein